MTNFVHLHIANFYMALHYNILAYNLQHFAGLIASSTSAQIVTGSHKYYAQVRWRAIQIPLFTKRRTRDDATAPIPIPYTVAAAGVHRVARSVGERFIRTAAMWLTSTRANLQLHVKHSSHSKRALTSNKTENLLIKTAVMRFRYCVHNKTLMCTRLIAKRNIQQF